MARDIESHFMSTEMEAKYPPATQVLAIHVYEQDANGITGVDIDAVQPISGDTQQDIRDMERLGKKQEFKRNFSFISTLGFISIYMATWEFVLVSLSAGLINGGYGGLFWTFI